VSTPHITCLAGDNDTRWHTSLYFCSRHALTSFRYARPHSTSTSHTPTAGLCFEVATRPTVVFETQVASRLAGTGPGETTVFSGGFQLRMLAVAHSATVGSGYSHMQWILLNHPDEPSQAAFLKDTRWARNSLTAMFETRLITQTSPFD
jgi:hypothetical protein